VGRAVGVGALGRSGGGERASQLTSHEREVNVEFGRQLVSIIVVHYGAFVTLSSCLNSIIRHTPNVEIIVVDNNQLPASFVEKFPAVKLIRSGSNIGFGAACNAGAKAASGLVLVFMNNDIEVSAGWLSALIRPFSSPSVGSTCPLVVLRKNPEVVNAAGGDADFVAFAWNRLMGRERSTDADRTRFFYAPGCCVAVRRTAFDWIGGFDESMFLFLEDVDLSWRLRMAGWDIVYAGDSVVYHEWMASTSQLTPTDIQYLFNRNRLRLILKNYGGATLLRVLMAYVVLQLGLILWIVRRRQVLELRAVIAALLWNLRNLPNNLKARQHAQLSRRRSDRDIVRFMYRGIAGIHLVLGTMKHPVFETYFNRILLHSLSEARRNHNRLVSVLTPSVRVPTENRNRDV